METLVAHPHHYSMHSVPYTHSPASSSHSSPYPVDQRHVLPSQYHIQAFDDSHARPTTSLQISTSTTTAHLEPEEETAHPSRPRPPTVSQHMGAQEQGAEDDMPLYNEESIVDSIGAAFTGLSRSLTHQERELLAHLDRLKFFLATAPSRWSTDVNAPADPSALPLGHPNSAHPALNRFLLPNNEYVSCVLWGGLYHITGTDIVRALVFRFEAFGRPVRNMKKFEEGVFSDLRNLKPGVDACLEEPKSPFLDLLFKYQCIRTQKKQKVFYWFSVPHDRLFLDALERDLKREKMGLEPTTVVTGEPALSFTYDPKRSLYDQFSKAQGVAEGEGELEAAVRRADEAMSSDQGHENPSASGSSSDRQSDAETSSSEVDDSEDSSHSRKKKIPAALQGPNSPFFSMFRLFEGSPTYKQRRKKVAKSNRQSPAFGSGDEYGNLYGMRMSEPQIDRYGRDTTRMSAAEMFMAQARGEFGPQSNPDLIATQKERQRRAMQAQSQAHDLPMQGYVRGLMGPGAPGQRTSSNGPSYPPSTLHPSGIMSSDMGVNGYPLQRPHVEQRHTFPLAGFHSQARTNTLPDSMPQGWAGAGSTVSEPIPITRTKAFVCPLFSCGRMFKRMEHLKRHLRTHTLERPFQCHRCKKRFSRSDNLNQHLRTHLRDGSDLGQLEDESSNADVESEEVDELADDDSFDNGVGYVEGIGNIQNVQMCEVEIQGQVQEVQGDEEGLVLPAGTVPQPVTEDPEDGQEIFYTDGNGNVIATSSEPSSFVNASPGVQWATLRPQPSPVFSTASMPSPQPRMTPSSSYSSSHMGEYAATSMSAPSHKAAFDHAALYPPELSSGLSAAGNGAGPIRRHRSATPSIGRYAEGIRRPYSAAISDHGSGRSFHPYANAIVSHSAESSPMTYPVPLAEYDPQQMSMSISRSGSHSRSSSSGQLQDQMHQMLNLEQIDPDSMGYAQESTGFYNTSRSDSPMQFATGTTGGYDVELTHAVPQQDIYGMTMGDQYAAQPVDATFYNAMGHQTSM